MQVVYVLYSQLYNKLYIGETNGLINRFHSHNKLSNKGFTKRYRPWFVILVEFYSSRLEAQKREQQLKSGKGREWIRNVNLPQYLK